MRNPSRPGLDRSSHHLGRPIDPTRQLDPERHRPVIPRPAMPGVFQGWGIRL